MKINPWVCKISHKNMVCGKVMFSSKQIVVYYSIIFTGSWSPGSGNYNNTFCAAYRMMVQNVM